ncbi:proline racemase family protein, partial [Candidatus Bipolaricaulota bacterium]|nr:proline racemase family protein [Candidatus Bipolaricaulota bacterium]
MNFEGEEKKLPWALPKSGGKIATVDLHTAGEPLRVVVDGFPELKGETILEKRRFIRKNYDYLRKRLMWEPRGHSDMYGALITKAENSDSDIGVIFMHNKGYSTMCGHGIIALVKVISDLGMIPKEEVESGLKIDTPAGLVT